MAIGSHSYTWHDNINTRKRTVFIEQMPTYIFFMQSDLNDERQNLKQCEENTVQNDFW